MFWPGLTDNFYYNFATNPSLDRLSLKPVRLVWLNGLRKFSPSWGMTSSRRMGRWTVSYTHLTLPTKRIV